MPSSNADTSCASTSCTSEDTDGHLEPRKGTCVFTPDMGGRNSVPELVVEDSVKENVAFSGNFQDLEGLNNVKASCLSEFCEEVKDTERNRKDSCDNPVGCESVQVVPAGDEHFETHDREKASAKKENSFGNENPKSEDASKFEELASHVEDEVKVISESCDSISSITTPIVLQKNSNPVKNKSDIGSGAEKKENLEQKEECNANPICNETIGRVSDNLGQDNDGVSIEVEEMNGRKNIDGMCIENETCEKTMPSHGQCQQSHEGENTMNNDVDAERSHRSSEITPEKQQNQLDTTILDFKNGKEDGSADAVSAPKEGPSDIINQSSDGPEQQIEYEPKKNKGQDADEIKVISISTDEIQSNHELHAIGEVHGIDNTCQHSEIESKSIPSSQDENGKTSLSECDINTNTRCEENLNKKDSGRLPLHNEFNMEQSTNYAKSPIKELTACHSSDNSPTKKSPIFQRGLFPRIAIRNPSINAASKLRKQLFIEKEKRGKREQQESDKALEMKKLRKQHAIDSKDPQNFSEFSKICCSTNDIKLKRAHVNLVRLNASMLSKYNVHVPPLHFKDSVDRTLNSVSLSCDGRSSDSEKRPNLEHEIEFQVECAVPVEGEQKTSAKSSPDKKDEQQLLKRSIPACIIDSTSCSELPPVNIVKSNSRTNCDTSSLENMSNSQTENDNTLLGDMEIKRRSKRRETAHAFTPTKKQKQSEMKMARVDIWKIDDLVLLKYGYDSKGLQIGKAATVPSPPAYSSVSSVVGKSQAVENVLNSPFHSNPTVSAQPNTNVSNPLENEVQLAAMKNSGKGEMNDIIKKSVTNSHKITNSAKKSFENEDEPLSNRVVLKNTSISTEKTLRKSNCSVGKSLTPHVVIKRIDEESLSSRILSKKACYPSSAKTNRKMKGAVKKAELDGKISRMIVKRNEQESLSGRILFNRSRSTKNSITKKKYSIKNKYKLKTAQVILKNINNSPLSSHILSEYLPSKSESSARVSKTNLHMQSTEILQKRLLPKKQIISRSKYCGDIDNVKEVVNKASSSKGDVQDHSKENVCLNSNLKCLKGVRVNLYKLESMIQPKLLSSKTVLSL